MEFLYNDYGDIIYAFCNKMVHIEVLQQNIEPGGIFEVLNGYLDYTSPCVSFHRIANSIYCMCMCIFACVSVCTVISTTRLKFKTTTSGYSSNKLKQDFKEECTFSYSLYE